MRETCPDNFPQYFLNPETVRLANEGGEFIRKQYRDGTTVWINQEDGELETHILGIGIHYDNPETKEIHFFEKQNPTNLDPFSEET